MVRSLARVAERIALSAVIGVPLLSCAKEADQTPAKPAIRECQEYLAAYDHCFGILGTEARAAGERALSGIRARIAAGDDATRLRESCIAGTRQLAASCR